jgi:hypothetical protein
MMFEHAKDIVDLLRYDENSQGLMGKEQVKWKTGM